jgi:Mg2+ and Co2+ transporter CorA
MNFALPEYRWPWGEWYALGLLVLTALATWWFLRRQRLD